MNELTPREEEVLRTFAEADPSTIVEVSRRLSIAPATCRTHIQNIEQKLGVHERTSAFRRKGWLVLP